MPSSTTPAVKTAATDSSHPLWVKEWTEGEGEATIRIRSERTDAPRTLYCSWFCPLAQRAWIALEELEVPYRYVEVNPYEVDPTEPGGYTKKSLTLEAKRTLMPDFVETSPRGLVPALHDIGDKRIWESSVLMEYLDEAYGGSSKGRRLLPDSPELRALVRIYVDHCATRIQKPYYLFLMEQDPDAQTSAVEELFRECRALACAMAPLVGEPTPEQILEASTESCRRHIDLGTLERVTRGAMKRNSLKPGPFFLGERFSAVDVALAPYWERFLWVGGHYRGLKFPVDDDPAFRRLQTWWEAASARPSVARTLVGRERLVASYSHYALDEATSDVARSMQSSLATKKQRTT